MECAANGTVVFWALLAVLLLAATAGSQTESQNEAKNFPKVREMRMDRATPPQGVACIECHKQETPGIFADWAMSRHASAGITCLDCHQAEPGDQDISVDHEKYYSMGDMPMGQKQYFVPVAAGRHTQGLLALPSGRSQAIRQKQTRQTPSKSSGSWDPWLNQGQ